MARSRNRDGQLNYGHGSRYDHQKWAARLRDIEEEERREIARLIREGDKDEQ